MRLSNAHVATKIALTIGLLLVAGALAVSALLAKESVASTESELPVVTIRDYRIKFGRSPLEQSLHGSMREYLPGGSQRETVLYWLDNGANRTDFYEHVQPVFAARCTSCHGDSGSAAAGIVLAHYRYVEPLATGRGPPRKDLLEHTHTHLFGIGLVLVGLAFLVAATRSPTWGRVVMVVLLPLGLVAEALSWWWTPLWEPAARMGWIGAHVLFVSVCGSVLLILLDLWISPPRGES